MASEQDTRVYGGLRLDRMLASTLDAVGYSVEIAVAIATVAITLASVTISAVETGTALARLI